VGAEAQSQFGSQPVGAMAGAQNVTVTAQVAGIVANVEVLTLGVIGLDFAKGAGALNCENATLALGATCTESVTFTPAAPGVRLGAVVVLDSNSNVLGTTYLSGTGLGGLGVLVPGNVLVVAGDGIYKGSVLDGNPAALASLYLPTSVTLDGAGNIYIADSLHNRVRKVWAATGLISTIVGNGNPTYTGDNGPAPDATLSTPSGVALDGAGNLYIADTGNNVVRMISASTGIITTVAGTGAIGSSGDGFPATSAELNQPQGVTVDVNGNLYIADTSNHRIRKVDAVSGIIITVAGNGVTNPVTGDGSYSGNNGPANQAGLNFPYAVAFDATGNMYIPDSRNNVVRKVASSGTITTFAGTGAPGFAGDGNAASSAALWSPEGVIADPAGNIYIADTQNASIRKVSSATGYISTIARNNTGEDFAGGAFGGVSIYGPIGLFLDGSGNLYVADSLNMIIQEIQSNFVALDFTSTPIRQGEKSATQLQEVENDGNAPFDVTAINLGINAALDPAATTCTVGTPLLVPVDGECEIGAVFAPPTTVVIPSPATQEQFTGNIDVVGNTVNTPLDIELVGIATVLNTTTTTLTSSPNPSGFGQSVSFTATVTTGAGTGTLTGTITFSVDGVNVGTPVTLNAAGVAAYTTGNLTVGVHKVTASYSNDPTHFSSASAPLTQTVLEGTITALSSNQNPADVGASVTFTATVTVPSGGGNVPPDGNVIFSDGATILGNTALNSQGVTSFTTSALANGLHSITATYLGNTNNQIQGSTSNVVNQDVQVPGKITLVSNPNPSAYGTPVTLIVAVAPTGAAAATGTVNILDGAQQIGTSALAVGTGQTSFTTSTLGVGTHSITAVYPGDLNYGPATSVPVAQVVNQAQTATTVTAVPSPGIAGGSVALTAVIKATVGVSAPSGAVTFSSGVGTLGSAAVGASGTATLSTKFAVGTYSIVATYAGDANDAGSGSAPTALTVQIATTATTLTVSPNPAIVQSPASFVAKVTGNGGVPSGSITFSADGASIGTAALDATGTATLAYSALSPGTHSITASYAGDANDSPSVSAAVSLAVTTIPTATALGASSTGSGTSTQATLVATVVGVTGPTPTGTVTFNSGTTQIGTATLNSSGVATLIPNLPTGSYNIVAVYSGDALHSTSTSQPSAISGTPTGFNLTVNPSSVSMTTGQNATVAVTLSSIGGYSDANIGFGCASLPAAVNCHFSSVSASLAANGAQTVQLTIDTNNPLSGGTTAMNAHLPNHGASLAGLFLPFSLCFGWIFWRFRKRQSALFTTVLVLLLSSAAMLVNGCSGFSQATAAPGAYTIQVTATGTNSDVIHYANVALNITK
jgi:hypothetical protein